MFDLNRECKFEAQSYRIMSQSSHLFWLWPVWKWLQIQLSHSLQKDWKRASQTSAQNFVWALDQEAFTQPGNPE